MNSCTAEKDYNCQRTGLKAILSWGKRPAQLVGESPCLHCCHGARPPVYTVRLTLVYEVYNYSKEGTQGHVTYTDLGRR